MLIVSISSVDSLSHIFYPLDRPCAMVIPDFELICEIMLVAEGLVVPGRLSESLCVSTDCRELLSKQVLEDKSELLYSH